MTQRPQLSMQLLPRMEQRLVLAPIVIQSISILQLPALRLGDLIKQNLEENPALEIAEPAAFEETGLDADALLATPDPGVGEPRLGTGENSDSFRTLDEFQARQGGAEFFNGPMGKRASTDPEDKKYQALQNSPARGETLQEYLYKQFIMLDVEEYQKRIAEALCFNIADNGYLPYHIDAVCEQLPRDLPIPGFEPEPEPARAPATDIDTTSLPIVEGETQELDSVLDGRVPVKAAMHGLLIREGAALESLLRDDGSAPEAIARPAVGPETDPGYLDIDAVLASADPLDAETLDAEDASLGALVDHDAPAADLAPETTTEVRLATVAHRSASGTSATATGGGNGAVNRVTPERPRLPGILPGLILTPRDEDDDFEDEEPEDHADDAGANSGGPRKRKKKRRRRVKSTPALAVPLAPPEPPLATVPRDAYFRQLAIETEEVRDILMHLDPPGCVAYDLRECLLVQLDVAPHDDPFVRTLIADHIEDVVKNRLPKIARETGVSLDEVKEGIDALRVLDPRPGAQMSDDAVHYIVPDVIVQEVDGRYHVEIIDRYFPKIHVNPDFARFAAEPSLDKDERQRIRDFLTGARTLEECIAQREHTIKRVAEAIVDHQRGFFDKGVTGLKPLKMQEIADRLGLHVSTISRAVSGKHMDTPRGVFPMKYFFRGGTSSTTGADESTEVVKSRIRDIVDGEDKRHPLSDEGIVKALRAAKGLKVARRTVTKYRKQMAIPSSRQRREY